MPEMSLKISSVVAVLKLENASTAPVSFIIYSWHSELRFSKRLAARSIISRRKLGLDLAQAGNATSAAATASRASCLEAEELDHTVSDVEGETTGKVVEVVISFPLIRSGTMKEAMVGGQVGGRGAR